MFNFKKVSAILTSAVMLGATMGFAAAASYPTPFVVSGTADVAVVYGTNALPSDQVAGISIKDDLATYVTGTGTTTSGGDSVQLTRSSEKLNIGDGIATVWGTALTDNNLKELLKDGTYSNSDNDEYNYIQKIDLANLSFDVFSDSDYLNDNDRPPTLGFHISSNTNILNYTIDFSTDPQSAHGTDLTDFESTDITILGKDYFILDFKNNTPAITLLDSAVKATLGEGESTTLTVDGTDYKVSLDVVSSTPKAKFTVNGETTNLLADGGTQTIGDAYLGVKTIVSQDYAGGKKTAEFSIGKGKLELTNSSDIKLNENTIEDLYAYISLSTSGSKRTWQKLVIKWTNEEEKFLTPEQDLLMPGFEAVKLTMGDTTIPLTETTTVDYSGDEVIELKTTIKDGDVTIPILYAPTAVGSNFTYIGKASDEKLATSNLTELYFNATNNADDGFVLSWADARDSESYYLKATVRRAVDGTTYTNYTTIINKITNEELCKDLDPDSNPTCDIGNIVLTINDVGYSVGGEKTVNMSYSNSGGSFHKLYTKEGLLIYLPYEVFVNTTDTTTKGAILINDTDIGMYSAGHHGSQFTLWFGEEDKNGDLDKKAFNVTLTSSGSTTNRVTVSAVQGDGTNYETIRSSKIWRSYVESELATMIDWDKTSSDQYSASIEYHGDEVYANLFVTAPSVTVGGEGSIGEIVILDSETSGMTNKNLIVVGGSCVNAVAANLVGGAYCTTEWESATGVGAGKYLIESYDNPYASGDEIALLVAGYNAADTTNAQKALINSANTIDTTAGKKYTGTTDADVALVA